MLIGYARVSTGNRKPHLYGSRESAIIVSTWELFSAGSGGIRDVMR